MKVERIEKGIIIVLSSTSKEPRRKKSIYFMKTKISSKEVCWSMDEREVTHGRYCDSPTTIAQFFGIIFPIHFPVN